MKFYPAGRAGYILAVVFRTPSFYKAHAYGTHFGELVDGLKTVINWLAKQLGKLLIVENLETTTRRDFAHGSWVEVVMIVAITALHKYTAVT